MRQELRQMWYKLEQQSTNGYMTNQCGYLIMNPLIWMLWRQMHLGDVERQ
jgi:hypothetical protein